MRKILLLVCLLMFPCLTVARESTLRRSPADSLTYSELFQFKKEVLLLQLTAIQHGRMASFDQRWQARFLWATLSAAFLGLCATRKLNEFKIRYGVPFFVIICFLFFYYDSHIAHVWTSSDKKADKAREELAKLPTRKYNELMAVADTLLRTRKLREEEYKDFSRWEMTKAKLGLGWGELDFKLFYAITGMMWIAGFINLDRGRTKLRHKYSQGSGAIEVQEPRQTKGLENKQHVSTEAPTKNPEDPNHPDRDLDRQNLD